MGALVTSCQDSINANDLAAAETLLRAAREIGGDAATLENLGNSLESEYIRLEENRIRSLQEMNRVKNVAAKFPKHAAERGTSGWVELIFTVTPTGETADIEVMQAEPGSTFNKSAIAAASQWEFEPLEFRGQIISQRATARLVYRLE